MAKKDATIIRDFNDAGTERSFTAGTIVSLDEGVFGNYEHAGLVREPTEKDRAAVAAPAAADEPTAAGAPAPKPAADKAPANGKSAA